MQITIRNVDDKTVAALDALAEQAGLSREKFLLQALGSLAQGNPDGRARLNNDTVEQIYQRTDRVDGVSGEAAEVYLGMAASSHLDRYFGLLKAALPLSLSLAEASLICDVLRGTGFYMKGFSLSSIPGLLAGEIDDACRYDWVDQRWKVDREQLVNWLADLTPTQALAVIDAVERFWVGPYREQDMGETLKTLGLWSGSND